MGKPCSGRVLWIELHLLKNQMQMRCYLEIHIRSWEWDPCDGISVFKKIHRELAVSALWGHSEELAIYKLGRESSLKTDHAGTLTFNIQTPELWENLFLSLKTASQCYFVWSPEQTKTGREEELLHSPCLSLPQSPWLSLPLPTHFYYLSLSFQISPTEFVFKGCCNEWPQTWWD